ncbi:hypothetical protein V6N13_109281 [Hibiscus sabdariffa]
MSVTSHAPGHFFPSPHTFQTSVAPLAVYPPPGPDFEFNYGMVQHTSPASLFATDLSASGGRDDEEDDAKADKDEEEDDDENDAVVQRNPRRNHYPLRCVTGGHRRH